MIFQPPMPSVVFQFSVQADNFQNGIVAVSMPGRLVDFLQLAPENPTLFHSCWYPSNI